MIKKRIAILVPSNAGFLRTKFAESLVAVVLNFGVWNAAKGNKYILDCFIQQKGYDISFMREQLARVALEQKFDYLIHLDSYETFPPHLVQMFMESFEKDAALQAITGLYHFKTPPFCAHAYHAYDEVDDKFTLLAGFPLERPFPVQGAGFGVLAMKREVYEQVPRPFFKMVNGVMGEDLGFFRKYIKTNGRPVRMVLDPRIQVGHLTEVSIGLKSYLKANGLKVENKTIKVPDKTLKRIDGFQRKLTEGFKSVAGEESVQEDLCALCSTKFAQKK